MQIYCMQQSYVAFSCNKLHRVWWALWGFILGAPPISTKFMDSIWGAPLNWGDPPNFSTFYLRFGGTPPIISILVGYMQGPSKIGGDPSKRQVRFPLRGTPQIWGVPSILS